MLQTALLLEQTTFYKADQRAECLACGGTGYTGRRAISEALLFSPAICRLILTAGEVIDEAALRDKALEEGMRTLQSSARVAVQNGETSITEMMRVVFTQ